MQRRKAGVLGVLMAVACPGGGGEGTDGGTSSGSTGAPAGTTTAELPTSSGGTTEAGTTGGSSTSTGAAETTGGESSTGAPAIPPECDGIPPSPDAAANHAKILACLTDHGVARLAPGEFPIDREIDMPDGSRLLGDDTWPRLVMVAEAQSLVRTHHGCEVAFLRLDGNHKMTVAHNAIVRIMGNDGFIHDNHVQNTDTGPVGNTDTVTGVRFWDPEVTGNRVFRNQIHHLHYGVIFDKFLNGADNLLEDNKIYEIRCDGVTFRGYGRAHGNEVYRVGFQCLNPPESPIPGGTFYTLENAEGAEIVGNHGHQACGQPLDLDRASRMIIKDNTFEAPGYVWDGHTICEAGITAHLLDISESVISGNTFRNDGAGGTVKSDPNHVFSATGSGVPSDLPAGANTAVAFALTHRGTSTDWSATHNTIEDNRFVAGCEAPCVGLGYYAGRGVGHAVDESWSAETTNYYRRNDPFGSNVGSKRCGGNWYAADSECPQDGADPDCNTDDYQHAEGPGHDWARNDDCPFYD
jgi:hypothetical protein